MLADDVLRRERLVSVWLDFAEVVYEPRLARALKSRGLASLHYLLDSIRHGRMPDEVGAHLADVARDLDSVAIGALDRLRYGHDYPIDHVEIMGIVAPAPNPSSRITLGTELDRLGQRRVNLDWRPSPIDKRSLRRTLEIVAMELGWARLGRLQITIDDSDTTWPRELRGAWHHMGTTRMSDEPSRGVVDRNCRVHGISNLFIAGSSVFPSAGSGTPTLMIVALALRLADHVKERLV